MSGSSRQWHGCLAERQHHPTITICPAVDHPRRSETEGYVLEVSTYTHSPLKAALGSRERALPGITMKDVLLARTIEDVWEDRSK